MCKSKHPLYATWNGMIARCNKPAMINYAYYGGRGIRVCERWMTFENFVADMGEKPSPDLEIDRIDKNGNYEPGNCRWASRKEQARNRRSNRRIGLGGRVKTAIEWEEETGIPAKTILKRIKMGWSPRDALLTPVRPY
jgi:hypothetical protein